MYTSKRKCGTGLARRLCFLVFLSLFFGSAALSTAQGSPSSHEASHPNKSNSKTLSVLELPYSQTVSFSLGAPATVIRLPVPVGLTPTKLSMNLKSTVPSPVKVSAKPVQSTLAHPPSASVLVKDGVTAFVVSLTGAVVVDGYLEISFSTKGATDVGFCGPQEPGEVTVQDVVMKTQGTATLPTSALNFFNASVETVDVVIPNGPSDSALTAGLNAVAASTRVLPRSARVMLLTQGSTRKFGPENYARMRRIEIIPSSGPVNTTITADASLVPTLTITGSTELLPSAVTTLGKRINAIADGAMAPSASFSPAGSESLTQPLKKFGAEDNLALNGFGTTSRSFSIPQASFGGPIERATLRLSGTHTAVPTYVGASLNVYWNDYLVSSQTLTSTSVNVVRDIAIPSTVMRGSNGLKFEFTALPRDTHCSGSVGLLPVGFYIDSNATTITGVRGDSLNASFPRFPQVLGNTLPVSFGSGLNAETATKSAGDLVSALQKVNPALLAVSVADPRSFIDSCTTGLFVGATQGDATSLAAPVRLSSFHTVKSTELAAGVGSSDAVGILEAFARKSCTVLMLGSWGEGFDAEQQRLGSSLAEFVATAPYGWSALYGSLLVALPETELPIQLTMQEVIPQQEVKNEYKSFTLWFGLGFGALLLLGIVGAWRRRARSRKISKYIDAEIASQQIGEDEGRDTSGPS